MGMHFDSSALRGVTHVVPGGFIGKFISSVAGILVLITILRLTFYIIHSYECGVLFRRGEPIRKRVGRRIGKFYIPKIGPRTGELKVVGRRIGIKRPGWDTLHKVDLRVHTMKLEQFEVDAPDGQLRVDADILTRVPWRTDGPEFWDYPVRHILASIDPGQQFESSCGKALNKVLKKLSPKKRQNDAVLKSKVDRLINEEIHAIGQILVRVNLRGDARVPMQIAVDAWPPTPTDSHTVLEMPHPVALAASEAV